MATKLKRRRSFLGRLLRDVLGNATTETVIMIPAFVIIWGGIYYTYLRHERYISMSQFTRADVWAHAYSACEDRRGDTTISNYDSDSEGFISGIVSTAMSVMPGFHFDEIEGQRTRSAQRPAVLGEGSAHMGHNLVVLCNEHTTEDSDLLTVALGMFL